MMGELDHQLAQLSLRQQRRYPEATKGWAERWAGAERQLC